MSHQPPLSAFRPPSAGTGSAGRLRLLAALLALLIAGAAACVLPPRSLLPLASALRIDGSAETRPESGR
jgi:hypothetical protein